MRVSILSSARWSSFWVSKQLLARALAQLEHEVLYVDPPASLLSIVRQPERIADLLGQRDEEVDGVHVWRPVVVPGQNSALGQTVNARLLERGVRRRLISPDLNVAFSLESRGLLPRLAGQRVYYCTDSHEDLPGVDADAYRRWELELARCADLTVACSLPLVDQLRARGVEATYLPHAVDLADDSEVGPPPAVLRDAPRPLLGYLGSLNFRLDVELLRRAAEQGTLVIIGGAFGPPAGPELRELLEDPRVIATGHQHPRDLARWIAHLDVGLIPYGDTPFNRKSFPIKLLQYLAAGVPVVSTPNGATDEHGDTVYVADDPETFGALIERAIAEDSPELRARRRDVAFSRTWGDVAAALLDATRATGP